MDDGHGVTVRSNVPGQTDETCNRQLLLTTQAINSFLN
jgi:hypothetical protein